MMASLISTKFTKQQDICIIKLSALQWLISSQTQIIRDAASKIPLEEGRNLHLNTVVKEVVTEILIISSFSFVLTKRGNDHPEVCLKYFQTGLEIIKLTKIYTKYAICIVSVTRHSRSDGSH